VRFNGQGVKGFQRDYSLRQKDEKLGDSADSLPKDEPEPNPKSSGNSASVNQVSDYYCESFATAISCPGTL